MTCVEAVKRVEGVDKAGLSADYIVQPLVWHILDNMQVHTLNPYTNRLIGLLLNTVTTLLKGRLLRS